MEYAVKVVEKAEAYYNRDMPSADRNAKKIRIKSLPDTDSFDIVRLVNVVAYHVFIINKQVIVAVATVPELLAETGRHVSILAWFTPQCAVIAAKIESKRGKTFLLLHGLSEKLYIRHSAIFSNCRKPDALAVDTCTGCNTVFVKGFFQISMGYFT